MLRNISILFLLVAITGCETPLEQSSRLPREIHVGVLPDQDASSLAAGIAPLLEYLSVTVGIPHSLVIPQDYDDLLRLFGEGAVDLAFFGGYSFVIANEDYGAIPLVMRDIDREFVSYFLVASDNDASSIDDLLGKRFTFGSSLSTSGHLMPRFFLKQQDIEPESFFSTVQYSGAHDLTARWVAEGKIDAGVANSQIIDKMFADGDPVADQIRILWQTPPYTDYVWAVQPRFDESLQSEIRDAFLSLSTSEAKHREILKLAGAHHYLPADVKHFSELKQVVADTRSVLH